MRGGDFSLIASGKVSSLTASTLSNAGGQITAITSFDVVLLRFVANIKRLNVFSEMEFRI